MVKEEMDMFCKNCGAQLADGTQFCTSCGAKVVSAVQQSQQVQPQQAAAPQKAKSQADAKAEVKPLNKKVVLGIVIGGCALLLAIIGLVIFLALNKYKTINLNDYIRTGDEVFTGVEGYGSVDYAKILDLDKLENDVCDAIEQFDDSTRDYILESFGVGHIEFDKDSNLKNGDEIKLTWKDINKDVYKESYGVIFDYSETTLKVSGLGDAEGVDVFEGVTVKFSGRNGEGYAEIDPGENKYGVDFELDKESDLSNGDVVTVSFDADSFMATNNYEYKAQATSKQFKVEGLTEALVTADQITDSMLVALQDYTRKKIKTDAAGWDSGEKLVDTNYVGVYVLHRKDDVTSGTINEVYVIYQDTISVDGKTAKMLEAVRFDDVQIDTATGSIKNSDSEEDNYLNGYYSNTVAVYIGDVTFYGYSSMEEFEKQEIESQINGYTYSKI